MNISDIVPQCTSWIRKIRKPFGFKIKIYSPLATARPPPEESQSITTTDHHHDGVEMMSKRIVTFMLFIQFRPQHVHGLCSITGFRALFMNQAPRSFLNGTHGNGNGSGRGQAYRTSTGMAMEQLSSASSSPGDNTHRIDGRNNLNYDLINSILQKHGVKSNELDERCLVALSGCPNMVAEYSVQAYAQQKRKREQKKEAKITDPSSYIMAVLR